MKAIAWILTAWMLYYVGYKKKNGINVRALRIILLAMLVALITK